MKFLLYVFIILSLFIFKTNSIYALNQNEETLLDASIFGDDDIVEKILEKNIDINIQERCWKYRFNFGGYGRTYKSCGFIIKFGCR